MSSLKFVFGTAVGVLPALWIFHSGPVPRTPPAMFDFNAPPQYGSDIVFRIVAFGSSSTRGVGASAPQFTYPARLERLLNEQRRTPGRIEVVNRGIDGQDIRRMLPRLQSDVLSRKPDLVIWQTGSNDSINRVPIDLFEQDLRAGLQALRAAGVAVIVMEPQWLPNVSDAEPTSRYLTTIHRVTGELGIPLIRRFAMMQEWMRTGLATASQIIGPDGLHMTDRGYELLANQMTPEVIKVSPGLKALVTASADSPEPELP